MDFFPTDIESDSDQAYGREIQRVARTWRQQESSRQLSCSIQGFNYFDTSLMDEDDIPTRDAGLDLSFSNQTSSNCRQSEPDPNLSVCSTDNVERRTPQPDQRPVSKKKKTKTKRRKEAEKSRNNNSLNMQKKLEQIEKGEFFEEEVKPETCVDIPIERRPSDWEVDKPFDLTVSSQNVDMMLINARFYQQGQVISLCKDLLVRCDVQNALYYRFVAEKHELLDVVPYVVDFVRANFTSIVKTHSFLGLSLSQLRTLLCDDGLKVQGELDVFDAACSWIDHCKHARARVVGEVMACVRFIHICPEDIVRHVEPHKNYFRGPGGREVLLSIYRYHALQGSQSDVTVLQTDLPPPRRYVPLGMEPTAPAMPCHEPAIPRVTSSVTFSMIPLDAYTTWTPIQTTDGRTAHLESVRQGSSQTLAQVQPPGYAQLYVRQQEAEADPLARPQSSQHLTHSSHQLPSQDGLQHADSLSQHRGVSPTIRTSPTSLPQGAKIPSMSYPSCASVRAAEEGDLQHQHSVDRACQDAVGGVMTQSVTSGEGQTPDAAGQWSVGSVRLSASSRSDWHSTEPGPVTLARSGRLSSLGSAEQHQASSVPSMAHSQAAPVASQYSSGCLSESQVPGGSQQVLGRAQTAGEAVHSSHSVPLHQRGSSHGSHHRHHESLQATETAGMVPSAHSCSQSGTKRPSGSRSPVHRQPSPLCTAFSNPSANVTHLLPASQSSMVSHFVAADGHSHDQIPEGLLDPSTLHRVQGRSASSLAETSACSLGGKRLSCERQLAASYDDALPYPAPPEAADEHPGGDHLYQSVSRIPSRPHVSPSPTGMTSQRSLQHVLSQQHNTRYCHMSRSLSPPATQERHQALDHVTVDRTEEEHVGSNHEAIFEHEDTAETSPSSQTNISDMRNHCTCRCPCSCSPSVLTQHCEAGCSCFPAMAHELSEQQLDELEERVKLRKKEIEKKTWSEVTHQQRTVHAEPSETDTQSVTSVRIHYCRSPQCSPTPSPHRMSFSGDLAVVQEETENDDACNDRNSSHTPVRQLYTEEADVVRRKRSVTFKPQLGGTSSVWSPPAGKNSKVQNWRLHQQINDQALLQNRQHHKNRQQAERQKDHQKHHENQQEQCLQKDPQLKQQKHLPQKAPRTQYQHHHNHNHHPEQQRMDEPGQQEIYQEDQDYQCNNQPLHGTNCHSGQLPQESSHKPPRVASPSYEQRQTRHCQTSPKLDGDYENKHSVPGLPGQNFSQQGKHAQEDDTPLPPQRHCIQQLRQRLDTDQIVQALKDQQAGKKPRSGSPAVRKGQARCPQLTRRPPHPAARALSGNERYFNENAPSAEARPDTTTVGKSSDRPVGYPYQPNPDQEPAVLVSKLLDYISHGTGLLYRHHPYTNHWAHKLPMYPDEALVVVVGGLNPKMPHPEIPCRLMDAYDPSTHSWSLMAKLPDARHHHGCVMLDGYLYLVGGSVVKDDDLTNVAEATRSCYRYDFGGNFWTAIAPMSSSRMYHAVAAMEGIIYAMGGETSDHCRVEDGDNCFLDSCEYYNPDTDEWGPIANMMDATIGAAVIGFRGLVWVIGGFVEHNKGKVVLGAVECYDPRTNSWISMNPLPVPLCHASVAFVLDTLFVVGGATVQDPHQPVASVPHILQYLEVDDVWVTFSSLTIPRHDAACCAVDSHLYVLGGVCSQGHDILQDVECIDVATGELLGDVQPLSSPALGLACVALGPEHFD